MTATAPATEPGEAPLSRSERLSRDVLHALMIDSKPWAEIQANRREVVRTTFRELDPRDEFEGMLAAQMAIAHSIFLGTSWLSLDRERPERDRTHYLRQATRLMTLYRQHFSALRQSRRERKHLAPYGARRLAARGHSAPDLVGIKSGAECPRCAARASAKEPASARPAPAEEFPPLDFPTMQSRRRRLMETAGLAFAQGP